MFLEEEREKELEGLFEAELDRDDVGGGNAWAGTPGAAGGDAEEGNAAAQVRLLHQFSLGYKTCWYRKLLIVCQ